MGTPERLGTLRFCYGSGRLASGRHFARGTFWVTARGRPEEILP
jgi:hypothetical protein